jgi:hypothetical protein
LGRKGKIEVVPLHWRRQPTTGQQADQYTLQLAKAAYMRDALARPTYQKHVIDSRKSYTWRLLDL